MAVPDGRVLELVLKEASHDTLVAPIRIRLLVEPTTVDILEHKLHHALLDLRQAVRMLGIVLVNRCSLAGEWSAAVDGEHLKLNCATEGLVQDLLRLLASRMHESVNRTREYKHGSASPVAWRIDFSILCQFLSPFDRLDGGLSRINLFPSPSDFLAENATLHQSEALECL